jgi:hypothetical protein
VRELPFQFVNQTIRVAYDMDATLLGRIRSLGRRDGDLNVNVLQSTDVQLRAQSLTGTTVVDIRPNQADMVTPYFGDYVRPELAEERRSYAIAKLRSLLDLLLEGGAKLQQLGIVSRARASAMTIGAESVRGALGRAVHLPREFADDAEIFDLSLRVSRAIDDRVYSNLSVDWYQTFVARLELPIGGALPQVHHTQIWDCPISDEGVEFRYDRNNNRGFFAGRREWTRDEFLMVLDAMMVDVGPALARVKRAIEECLESTGA